MRHAESKRIEVERVEQRVPPGARRARPAARDAPREHHHHPARCRFPGGRRHGEAPALRVGRAGPAKVSQRQNVRSLPALVGEQFTFIVTRVRNGAQSDLD